MESLEEYLCLKVDLKKIYLKNCRISESEELPSDELYLMITDDAGIVLNLLNISPSKVGYQYWKDAIFLYYIFGNEKLSICNKIYPAISKRYGKTISSIERAMRLCFENALYYSAKSEKNFIFDYMKNCLLYPHNSEIMVKIAELISTREFQKKKFSI